MTKPLRRVVQFRVAITERDEYRLRSLALKQDRRPSDIIGEAIRTLLASQGKGKA